MKKYLLGGKRVLCGILTAALIMTGINVPELSVKAATENSNNADQSEIKTEIASEMNSEESTETALQDSTTLEESSTTENSSEESETEKAKSTEETTEETTEKNSDEKTTDEEKSDEEASTEEKSDEEKSDEEASTEEKSDEEKSDKENPVDNDSEEQNNTDGTLQNGDFESGNWTYEPWEITVGDGNTLEVKSDATNRYINIWMNSEADVSIKQTVTNVKGGSYKCSLKQMGKFNNELSLKVKKDNEELASKSLGALEEWNNWQNIVTDEFEVAQGDTIVVEISGHLPADEGIKLDDILLQVSSDTFTKAQLEELYNKYKDYKETDYTAESWTAFKTALDAAKEIIDSSENDEDKITTAYKALQDAAGKLEQQGISFKLHFYADNLADDDQLGVFLWEKANIKFSDTTAKAEWKVWDKDCFLMTKSKYTGWCSIDIVVPSENAENGFEIYKASKNENGEYTTEKLYAISQSWDGKDIYAELVSKEAKEYALKNNKIYKDTDAEAVQRNVTLYVYDSEGTPAIISGKNKLKSVDMETGNIKALEHSYMDEWNNLYYDMTADEKAKGWYYLTLSVPSAGDNEKAFELYRKDGTGKYTWIKNFINGSNTDDYSVDINPVFAGNVYYKNGEFLNNQGISSEMAELKKLIAEAEKLDKKDYTEDSWNAFAKALNEAKAITEKEDSATDEEIKTAKEKLENAKKGLKYSRQADINVEKIPLADDFITGADLSSYISLIESGAVFKDENGNALSDDEFFKKVADGGTNWVRIRVWDNPYDSSGNSYGGGHNDIKTAIKIGKLATQAGMRVLIDFHYSDFWVDPAKYKAPKAWAGKTVAEKVQLLYDHTYNNLKKLHDAGVDVGMVQVGNETNNGMAGVSYSVEEDICSLFSAGSSAVRQFSKEVNNGDEKAVKVAVHFADPQKGFGKYAALFDEYNVDYDVFAASYYPNIHEYSTGKGETNSLRETLEYVAKTYGKQVMVAETSWPTSWEDGDGHGNNAPKLSENLQYDISVQGQADEMYAVVKAVSEVTNGIGVFYWEPAWIPVGYAYNDDGSVNETQLSKNKALWEKYGSGWASSYAGEYDAEDAGTWFGGSSMDNQSWFDFDGTALPTLNTYSYIRTGSVCETKKISSIMKKHEYELSVGDEVKLPEKIEAKFNDGTSAEFPVEWDKETVKLVSTDKAGQYTINGVVTCEYNNNIKNVVEKYNVVLTLYVLASKDSNLIINSGFEDGINGWKIVYDDGTENALSGYTIKATEETPHSDKYGLNFYREDKGLSFKVFQTRTNLPVGIYDFGGFIQGGGANEGDVSYAYVKVTSDKGEERYTLKSECEFKGWKNWSQPQITGFAVNAGDTVEVGFEVQTSKAGSWGSIDDLYIYGSYGVNVDAELKNGSITVSDNMVRCGEKVNFTVTPDDGYAIGEKAVLYKVNEDGKKEQIQECILDSNGAGSFTMPAYPVVISTEFKEIEDIDFNDVTFADIPVQIYTGKAIIPEINAYYKSYALVEGKDYTVTCENNVAVSTTAKVIVTGKGRFKGTKELIFEIRKAVNLKDAIVEINGSDFTDKNKVPNFYYTSKEIKPQDIVVKVKTENGEAVLEKNEDYIVEYENDTRIGNAKLHIIAVEGNAKYTGSITKTYKIVKANLVELANNGKIEISTVTGGNYSGKEIKPNVTIKYGMYTLIKEKDYTVTYKNNKNVTRDKNNSVVKNAEVIIKGKGSFTGELSVKTLVDNKNTAFAEKLKFMVSPQYLNRDAITAKSKTLVYTGKALKYSITVTSDISGVLKQGRDYKIIRYKFVPLEAGKETVSAAVTDNKVSIIDKGTYTLTLEGTGNYAGSTTVDVKVTDQLHNIANAKVEVKATDFTGNAVELVPYSESTANSYGIKISDKSGKVLTQDDYELEYENNTNAGNSASVTVIGKGEYAGTKTVKFKINKADIKENLKENGLTLKEVEGKVPEFFYYTGYALKPDYVVAVKLEKEEKYQKKSSKEITLVAGRDYTITYSNNVTGKKQKSQTSYLANVTIKGKGNYTGTLKAVFEIKPTDLDDFIVRVDKAEYTGKAVKPVITFTHRETNKNLALKEETAYKVFYKNNKNVANENSKNAPEVIIKSKGLGYGDKNSKAKSVTKKFCITNAKIDASSVADIKVQSYKNGKAVKPAFVVKVKGKVLKKNRDYKITYDNNRLRGRATATITGIGNYTGTVKKEFVIK